MEKMEQIGKAVLDYRFYPPEIVHLSNMNV